LARAGLQMCCNVRWLYQGGLFLFSNHATNYRSERFLTLLLTFAATASAGLRGCVPVRWHKCLHAGADACEPSETRIGCEPLLPAARF